MGMYLCSSNFYFELFWHLFAKHVHFGQALLHKLGNVFKLTHELINKKCRILFPKISETNEMKIFHLFS